MKKREQVSLKDIDNGPLEFLYHNVFGRVILKVLTRPFVSNVVGKFMDTKLSCFMIKSFIEKNNIDMSEYVDKKWTSYNDFFTRKIKSNYRKIGQAKDEFISPCDSKLSVYKIDKKSVFKIKNAYYKVSDLLKNNEIAKEYNGGYAMIFRLTVDDYHRYSYVDDGEILDNYFIKGVLHTIKPIALDNYNFYKENCREVTVMQTRNFGQVVSCEVGAMMVGRISNIQKSGKFSKGSEKGMFEFGGSTIVLLVKENVLEIDEEIIDNSKNGYETVVKLGEKIAIKK